MGAQPTHLMTFFWGDHPSTVHHSWQTTCPPRRCIWDFSQHQQLVRVQSQIREGPADEWMSSAMEMYIKQIHIRMIIDRGECQVTVKLAACVRQARPNKLSLFLGQRHSYSYM